MLTLFQILTKICFYPITSISYIINKPWRIRTQGRFFNIHYIPLICIVILAPMIQCTMSL